MTEINTQYYAYLGFGIALAVFGLIALFYVANGWGLTKETSNAVVLDKQYTPAGTTYRTTVVNNQSIVQAQEIGEIYGVVFEIDGQQSLGVLTKSQYEDVSIGDEVSVTYERTRLTKRLNVLSVRQ